MSFLTVCTVRCPHNDCTPTLSHENSRICICVWVCVCAWVRGQNNNCRGRGEEKIIADTGVSECTGSREVSRTQPDWNLFFPSPVCNLSLSSASSLSPHRSRNSSHANEQKNYLCLWRRKWLWGIGHICLGEFNLRNVVLWCKIADFVVTDMLRCFGGCLSSEHWLIPHVK